MIALRIDAKGGDMDELDVNRDALIELQRNNAALAFAGGGSTADYRLAYDTAKMVGDIVFQDGERMVSVWEVDGSFVVVAAWGPGEQEPSHQTLVLEEWR
jgi:hypothetical protein